MVGNPLAAAHAAETAGHHQSPRARGRVLRNRKSTRVGGRALLDADAEREVDRTYDWALLCRSDVAAVPDPEPQPEFPVDEVAPTAPLVRELKLKLLGLGLSVHGYPNRVGGKHYYIQIAASESMLEHFAERMGLPKRLTTKASLLADKLYALQELERSAQHIAVGKHDPTSAITLWVANLHDGLFSNLSHKGGTERAEQELREVFSQFADVRRIMVRKKHGDASSNRHTHQSWALVTVVMQREVLNADGEWAADLLDNLQLHGLTLLVQLARKTAYPHPPADLSSKVRNLEAKLAKETARRKHADFGGLVPYVAERRDEFQKFRSRHYYNPNTPHTRPPVDQIFCSGERQRILKFALESEDGGLDLSESKLADIKHREQQWKVYKLESLPLSKQLTHLSEVRQHLIKSTLVDEFTDRFSDAKDHLAWLSVRLEQLMQLSEAELRHVCRTWDVIYDYFPLHDMHELEYLRENWINVPRIMQAVRGTLTGKRCGPHSCITAATQQPLQDIRSAWPAPVHEHVLPHLIHLCVRMLHYPENLILFGRLYHSDYFGEQIAIYFAFIEVYAKALIWPTLCGALVSLGYVQYSVEQNPLSYPHIWAMGLWSVYFLATWRRRNSELMFLWGTEHYEVFEQPRDEFLLLAKDPNVQGMHFEPSEITGKMEAVASSPMTRYFKMTISLLVLLIFFFFIYGGVMATMWIKVGDVQFGGNKLYAEMTGLMFLSVYIFVLERLYEHIAEKLANWENHRTQTEYDNSRITKTFLFDSTNHFFALFFVAFFKGGVIPIPVLDPRNSTCTTVEFDCDDTLSAALRTQCSRYPPSGVDTQGFLVSADQMVPSNRSTLQQRQSGRLVLELPSCMQELWRQLVVVLCCVQFITIVLGVAVPIYQHKLRFCLRNLRLMHRAQDVDMTQSAISEQATLPIYDSNVVLKLFSRHAIQFGYSILFVVAFPFAPGFALLHSLIKHRTEAYNLCFGFRRPEYQTRKGIGAWLLVFEATSLVSVLTNSALICFVGGGMATMIQSVAENNEQQRYELLAHTGAQAQRVEDAKLWMLAGITEHCLLAIRFLAAAMIPTVPKWINVSKIVISKEVEQRMDTAENLAIKARKRAEFDALRAAELVAEREQLEEDEKEVETLAAEAAKAASERLRRMMSSIRMAQHLRGKGVEMLQLAERHSSALKRTVQAIETARLLRSAEQMHFEDTDKEEEAQLRQLWKRVDVDGSGSLERAEIEHVMLQMGHTPTDEEFSQIMKNIDADGSGCLNFEEFLGWWRLQDPVAQQQLTKLKELNFDEL